MHEMLQESVYFGMTLSLVCYFVGKILHKKFPYAIVNPLLIATFLIIGLLAAFDIDYEVYDYGAKYITYFLTPATICLAVPLYKQITALKQNVLAVIIGIVAGCIAHGLILLLCAFVFNLNTEVLISLLPKSVTTPIALSICAEMGGIQGMTVIGVVIAGMGGAIIGPGILKLFRITEPVAQGLAVGAASHAVGTSRMIKMGEVQAAMSSLAIVVTGILTVIVVPVFAEFL